MAPLTLRTIGDTQIEVTRTFAAPPELVFRAHLEPELVSQWMTGPDGWTMSECVSDTRPGGSIRYAWRNAEGHGFHLTGEFHVIEPHSRIVHVERMFLPDPTPDNHVETRFFADGSGTRIVMLMTVPDAETRAAMLATGMTDGMEASYARLEQQIVAQQVH